MRRLKRQLYKIAKLPSGIKVHLIHCKFTVVGVSNNVALCVIVSNRRFKMFNNKSYVSARTKALQVERDGLKGTKFTLNLSKCNLIKIK